MKAHRKDKPGAPPFPERQEPSGPGSDLLTSEDLFGDLIDTPLPAKPTRPVEPPDPAQPRGPARGPIRVQVSEPGVPKKPSPLSTPGGDVLPADVAALLDAFSEPAEAALRAEESGRPEPDAEVMEPAPESPPGVAAPGAESPPELAASAAVVESPSPEDLLDVLMTPEPDPVPDVGAGAAPDLEAASPATIEPGLPEPGFEEPLDGFDELPVIDDEPGSALLDEGLLLEPEEVGLVVALEEEVAEPAPLEPPEPATSGESDAGLETSLQDLLSLQASLPVPAPPVKPAARMDAKFTAAPAKKAQDLGGIDLAALAEEALGVRPGSADASGAQGAASVTESSPGAAAEGTAGDYGPYRLLERIAVGGMAEVFRAKRAGVEGFEKVVAVKRILAHLSDNKEFVDMFIDEAKMVAGLSHPSIVQIFDLGRIERSYYIAMEHVHGKDLRTILRRAKERGLRTPLDISAFIVSKVCAALEYAHRKKDDRGRAMMLVHRDISPQNILISFEGDVKLTDFGIAKAATKATVTDRGALRGKLLYMSPEQAWGKPLDKRSDVFSLGIVFYEMLTEQKPFLGSSEMSILETVRECRVSPPTTLNPRIPEKLERVVMKALERDPELRYQDAGEMHRDLERVLHEWQPANASGLVRFLEVLFDEDERGVGDGLGGVEGTGHVPPPLEVELHEPPPPRAPAERPAGKDPMSIQKLLKRFGIK